MCPPQLAARPAYHTGERSTSQGLTHYKYYATTQLQHRLETASADLLSISNPTLGPLRQNTIYLYPAMSRLPTNQSERNCTTIHL